MIWFAGRIVPEDELAVNARDRVFEHGLGLFETMRTWNGRARLLSRHLERLKHSAGALGLPLDPRSLPNHQDVAALLEAIGSAADAIVRIVLTGGVSRSGGSALWMRATELPVEATSGAAIPVTGFWEIASDDPLARHKTLNSWRRRLVYEQARAQGFEESLSRTADGSVWEGCRTNLFWVTNGALFTPPSEGPILPGVMRGLVLESARGMGIPIAETPARVGRLREAEEVFMTNSVRGIVPVARLEETNARGTGAGGVVLGSWDTPGPDTCRLKEHLARWIRAQDEVP
jgi:branched-subunit amino acid aminotransferase/4-amino-4-deoxychorismate lyase